MLVDRGVFAEEAKFSVRNFKLTFNWIVLLLHWIQSVKSVQLSSDLSSKYVLISSTVFLVSVVSVLHSETVSENKCGLKSVRRVIEPHTTINKSLAAQETVDSCSSSSEMLVEKVMFQHFYESNLCLMSAKLGLKFNERKSASTCWILLFSLSQEAALTNWAQSSYQLHLSRHENTLNFLKIFSNETNYLRIPAGGFITAAAQW